MKRRLAAEMTAMRTTLFQIHLAALLFSFSGLFGRFLDLSPATITFERTVFCRSRSGG